MVLNKYRSGFAECANEVTRYLGKLPGLSADIRARMFSHLTSCLQAVDLNASGRLPGIPGRGHMTHSVHPVATALAAVPGYSTSILTATPVFNVQIGLPSNAGCRDQSIPAHTSLTVKTAGQNNGSKFSATDGKPSDYSASPTHHSYAVDPNNNKQQCFGPRMQLTKLNYGPGDMNLPSDVSHSTKGHSAAPCLELQGVHCQFPCSIGQDEFHDDGVTGPVWRPW